MSWKVKEGQSRSCMVFSHHRIDISGEKSYWWGGTLDLGVSILNLIFNCFQKLANHLIRFQQVRYHFFYLLKITENF